MSESGCLCHGFTDRCHLWKRGHVASANHIRAEHQSKDWLCPNRLTIQQHGEVLLLENEIRTQYPHCQAIFGARL